MERGGGEIKRTRARGTQGDGRRRGVPLAMDLSSSDTCWGASGEGGAAVQQEPRLLDAGCLSRSPATRRRQTDAPTQSGENLGGGGGRVEVGVELEAIDRLAHEDGGGGEPAAVRLESDPEGAR
ncbi:hypothetical protein EYF80_056888 [Liparis tanakae]|uniref:Uncharacterized protein n=1 Tax=Liparis tanakae TaxID=230148 RepID=A0A4Z2EVV8_9TELE|nr:hypothetical protein EYF80_056888 [Liparis tanakae]